MRALNGVEVLRASIQAQNFPTRGDQKATDTGAAQAGKKTEQQEKSYFSKNGINSLLG